MLVVVSMNNNFIIEEISRDSEESLRNVQMIETNIFSTSEENIVRIEKLTFLHKTHWWWDVASSYVHTSELLSEHLCHWYWS